jgi:hypothetical protein
MQVMDFGLWETTARGLVIGKAKRKRPPEFPKISRSQPVDATPSDMNHFSKGDVDDPRKTGQASAEQRTDKSHRWKAGELLHEIGRAFGKDRGSIQFHFVAARRYISRRSSALAATTSKALVL